MLDGRPTLAPVREIMAGQSLSEPLPSKEIQDHMHVLAVKLVSCLPDCRGHQLAEIISEEHIIVSSVLYSARHTAAVLAQRYASV